MDSSFRYSSPSPDSLNLGVLAAEAVREIAACFEAFVSRADGVGTLRMEPTAELETPPLKVYTFMPVTGQIMCRSLIPGANQTPGDGKKNKKTKNSANKESTSNAKKSVGKDASKAVAKNLKAALEAAGDEMDDEEAEEETEDDDDEDDDAAEDSELTTLDKLAAAGKKSKGQKRATWARAVKKAKGSIETASGGKVAKIAGKKIGKANEDAK